MELEIYNNNITNIDITSFVKFFLIEELIGNAEAYWSTFLYKDRNDDKFYFGPGYDFDLALDNDERLIPTNEKNGFCFQLGGSAGTLKEFIMKLIENKNVMKYIQNVWEQLCSTVLNETVLLNFLEEREIFLKESSELNFLKWDNCFEKIPWEGPNYESDDYGRKGENFKESVQVLKDYIKQRFDSFTKIINNAVLSAN